MPLVVFCGHPGSGKTTRANDLIEYLKEDEKEVDIVLVNEESLSINRSNAYKDPVSEKQTRSLFRSAVERNLSQKTVVILDSINNVKGFRYELFTRSKSANTTHCIVYCDTSIEKAREWNESRENPDERYDEDSFNDLVMRLEVPISKNRWDRPLFTVKENEQIPCKEIADLILHGKKQHASVATILQKVEPASTLYELDQTTQSIVKAVMESQNLGIVGGSIKVPNTDKKVFLPHKISLPQLNRLRKRYIKITSMHPLKEKEAIANSFVEYLNSNIL